MIMVETFHGRINDAMKLFNKTHGKEVQVRLVNFSETEFDVVFSGKLKETCDIHTHIESFEYEFSDEERAHIRRVDIVEEHPKLWRVRYLLFG